MTCAVTDVTLTELGLSMILAEQELGNAIRAYARAKNRERCAMEEASAAQQRVIEVQNLIDSLKLVAAC